MTIHLSPEDKAARAKAMRKAREATPAARAKATARRIKYAKTPGARANRKAREATPEAKAYRKAYNARPDVKAKRQASKATRTMSPAEKANKKRREKVRQARILATLEGRIKSILKEASRNSLSRGREYTITYDDIVTLYNKQRGLCALTGWELNCITRDPRLISIDRIDSDKGYTLDNIHLVAWAANKAKLDVALPEFLELCRAVAAHTS